MRNFFNAVFLIGVTFICGCATPQMDARVKAQLLREKGYYREAQELEEKANDLPKYSISSETDSEYNYKRDLNHLPEYYEREKKKSEDKK